MDPSDTQYREYECTKGTVKLDPAVLKVDINLIKHNRNCSTSNIAAKRSADKRIIIDTDIIIIKSKVSNEGKDSVIRYDGQNDHLSMVLESGTGRATKYECDINRYPGWAKCPLNNFFCSVTKGDPATVELAFREWLEKPIQRYCNNKGEVSIKSTGHLPPSPSTVTPYSAPVNTGKKALPDSELGDIEIDSGLGDAEPEDMEDFIPPTPSSPAVRHTPLPLPEAGFNTVIYVKAQKMNERPDEAKFYAARALLPQEYFIYDTKLIIIVTDLDHNNSTRHHLCQQNTLKGYIAASSKSFPPLNTDQLVAQTTQCAKVENIGKILRAGGLETLPQPQKLTQLIQNFAEGFAEVDSSSKSSTSKGQLAAIIGAVIGTVLAVISVGGYYFQKWYQDNHSNSQDDHAERGAEQNPEESIYAYSFRDDEQSHASAGNIGAALHRLVCCTPTPTPPSLPTKDYRPGSESNLEMYSLSDYSEPEYTDCPGVLGDHIAKVI